MEFFSDISPRFASPFGRSSHPPKSVAKRLHAHPRQLLYAHSGGNMPQYMVNRFAEEIARGETELALICGAELLRSTQNARRAGMALDWNEDPGGEPDRVGDKRFGYSDEEARHELRAAIHFYPLAGECDPRRPEARRAEPHAGDGPAVRAAGEGGARQSAGDAARGLQRRAAGDDLRRQSLDLLPLPAPDERQRDHRPGGCRADHFGWQGARMGHPAGALGVPAWLRRRHRHLGRVGARPTRRLARHQGLQPPGARHGRQDAGRRVGVRPLQLLPVGRGGGDEGDRPQRGRPAADQRHRRPAVLRRARATTTSPIRSPR